MNHSNTDIETDPKKVMDGINEVLREFGIKPLPETLTQEQQREVKFYCETVRKQMEQTMGGAYKIPVTTLADVEAAERKIKEREELIRDAWRQNYNEAIHYLRKRGVFVCTVGAVQCPEGLEIEHIVFEMKRKSGNLFAILCEGFEMGEIEL